jgi:hypothetical protein
MGSAAERDLTNGHTNRGGYNGRYAHMEKCKKRKENKTLDEPEHDVSAS